MMRRSVALAQQAFRLDGTIRTPTGLALRNIPVQLTGNGVAETLDCDTLGFFAFQDVPQGDTVRLRPQNNANWLNGVTTFDLVLISKHILGITPLGSPLKNDCGGCQPIQLDHHVRHCATAQSAARHSGYRTRQHLLAIY
jgi:hypothetical protein